MNSIDLTEILDCATHAAKAGAHELMNRLGTDLKIESKTSLEDKVTDADLASEKIIRQLIQQRRPGDSISGEEFEDETVENAQVRWSIDPLDGTVNFTRGIPFFATSVAAQDLESGVWIAGVVVAPALDFVYSAKKGGGAWLTSKGVTKRLVGPPASRESKIIATGFSYSAIEREQQFIDLANRMPDFADVRRMGSAALDACFVADGSIDAYYERHIKEHDWAAALLIAEEAGQQVKRPKFSGDVASVNLN